MLSDLLKDNLKKEITFKTSRSGGKGGQNVNKVETKVELLFDIKNTKLFDLEQRQLLLKKLSAKINEKGLLKLSESKYRSQLQNKETVIAKFFALLSKSLTKPKARKATKPTKTSKEKRIDTKKKHSELKKWRKKLT